MADTGNLIQRQFDRVHRLPRSDRDQWDRQNHRPTYVVEICQNLARELDLSLSEVLRQESMANGHSDYLAKFSRGLCWLLS